LKILQPHCEQVRLDIWVLLATAKLMEMWIICCFRETNLANPQVGSRKTELSMSQQPSAPPPKLTCLCWSKFILLGRKAVKTQMLEKIGCTAIRKPTFIPTKDMWKLRNKLTPPPKMKKSPHPIECSSTLLQMGQVGHLSFACNCQTHGDVDHLHWDVTALCMQAHHPTWNYPCLNAMWMKWIHLDHAARALFHNVNFWTVFQTVDIIGC